MESYKLLEGMCVKKRQTTLFDVKICERSLQRNTQVEVKVHYFPSEHTSTITYLQNCIIVVRTLLTFLN